MKKNQWDLSTLLLGSALSLFAVSPVFAIEKDLSDLNAQEAQRTQLTEEIKDFVAYYNMLKETNEKDLETIKKAFTTLNSLQRKALALDGVNGPLEQRTSYMYHLLGLLQSNAQEYGPNPAANSRQSGRLTRRELHEARRKKEEQERMNTAAGASEAAAVEENLPAAPGGPGAAARSAVAQP